MTTKKKLTRETVLEIIMTVGNQNQGVSGDEIITLIPENMNREKANVHYAVYMLKKQGLIEGVPGLRGNYRPVKRTPQDEPPKADNGKKMVLRTQNLRYLVIAKDGRQCFVVKKDELRPLLEDGSITDNDTVYQIVLEKQLRIKTHRKSVIEGYIDTIDGNEVNIK
jgi:predicted transcriptional regulator